ncbi:hypothetical protein BABINDRAFT_168840 [Babjeviella inositovora NRRL Y-12698]|uniref:SWR1-complex protein 3 n=1 Tax=Babjeviella inositovora NRRL Y-12698 TaxID=984486 RepID=A0A1E3QK98_9ASCO|nr:uncharacterized protein BABINDRAFT_168840 [Babjeviella inositovora NRRL Y-12698]ODQ77884.1 hypothetical protein BABINDRAFT_168840 [Babjeviella inositovora NRRL Y-12698]
MPPRIKRRTTVAARRIIALENEAELEKVPRPFEIVSRLPVSTNEPDYSVLAYPLSIKDSAVLYTSLARSRKTWLDATTFQLYWSKVVKGAIDEAGNEIQNTNARDKMNKLCDCMLELGPHTFEIRLFLVKDERSTKKEKPEPRFMELGVKPEYGYHPNGPIVYAPDVKRIYPPIHPIPQPPFQAPNAQIAPPASLEPQITPPASSEPQVAPQTPTLLGPTVPKTSNKPFANPPSSVLPLNAAPKPTPVTPVPSQTDSPVPAPGIKQAPPDVAPRPLPPPNDIMQTPENTMMINNLNAIARVDPPLNTLMKIVASGGASTEQILEFQGYIQRARDMGYGGLANYKPPPTSSYRPIGPKGGAFPKPLMKMPKLPKPPKPLKEAKPPKEPKDARLKAPKTKIPKELRLTAFQEKYLHDANLVFEFVENSNVRYWFPKEAIYEIVAGSMSDPIDVSDLPDLDQINTEDGEILVSFMVIHNRVEVEEYERLKRERAERIKKKEEEKERLKREAEEAKLKEEMEAQEAAKLKEQAITNGTEEKATDEATKEGDTDVVTEEIREEPVATKSRKPSAKKGGKGGRRTSRKRTRSGQGDALDDEGGSKDDEDVEPELIEPDIKYTTMTVRLSNIPHRFIPIVVNSFKPQADVVTRMEYILEHGTRMPKYQMWYQLDGKRDEQLAESLRVCLNENEKHMGTGKRNKYKKRAVITAGASQPVHTGDHVEKIKVNQLETVLGDVAITSL